MKPTYRRLIVCQSVAVFLAGATGLAQRIWAGGYGRWRTPPKWAALEDFDGSFIYCRGFYTSDRRGGRRLGVGHRLSGSQTA